MQQEPDYTTPAFVLFHHFLRSDELLSCYVSGVVLYLEYFQSEFGMGIEPMFGVVTFWESQRLAGIAWSFNSIQNVITFALLS